VTAGFRLECLHKPLWQAESDGMTVGFGSKTHTLLLLLPYRLLYAYRVLDAIVPSPSGIRLQSGFVPSLAVTPCRHRPVPSPGGTRCA